MDIMNLWDDLENNVIKYNEANRQLLYIINYYEKNCKILIKKFKTISFDESNEIFNQLFEVQSQLATLKYKYEFEMNDYIENFIYYFDRQDDENKICLYQYFHNNDDGWPS